MSAETTTKKEKPCPLPKAVDDDTSDNPTATDGDDEFVSELHQASSKDVADADEALKKLGLAKVKEQIQNEELLFTVLHLYRMMRNGRRSLKEN